MPHLGMIEWGKADHWDGFKKMILRTDYGPFEIGRSWSLVYDQLATAVWVLLTGLSISITGFIYGIIICICALFGFSWLWQKNRSSTFFLGGIALIVWIFFCITNNHPMTRQLSLETRDVFFIPAYLIYGIFTGLGICRIALSFYKHLGHIFSLQSSSYIISVSCFLLPCMGCFVQFTRHNEHNYYLAYDFGKNILDTMEPGSLFIGDDDLHVFPVWYLQQVEHYRPDIIVLSRTSLYKKWYYEGIHSMKYSNFQIPIYDSSQVPKEFIPAQTYLDWQMFQFFEENIKLRPCYFYEKYALRVVPKLSITQEGLIYHVTEKPLENTVQGNPYPYTEPKVDYLYRYSVGDINQKDFWRVWALQRFSEYHLNQGIYSIQKKEYSRAEKEFKQAVNIQPENIPAHYQLGLLYQNLGEKELALESFNRVLYLDSDYRDTKMKISNLTIGIKNSRN